jgi:hypothetical protein
MALASGNQISTISSLANLTSLARLNLENNQISDISPLATLTDLTWIDLGVNQISDIAHLANLTGLTVIDLGGNQISDISPLVQNQGLGTGDEVDLLNNPLSFDAINIHIPQLQARDVIVHFTLASTISMITPYVNETDINPTLLGVFCSSDDCPLGFAHNGLDLHATGDLKPFQAVCSGVVENVELMQLPTTLHWQVAVSLKYNDMYLAWYAFEPMTTVQSDGETQLANTLVSEGQTVSQGDIIAYLYTAHAEYAHVHFMLVKNGVAVCPEPYFTSEARDSILSLVNEAHPGWNMCY